MAVEGGMKCVKYLLFFFNFIFWLCGLALIVIGVMAHLSIQKVPVMNEISGTTVPLVIIVVGVIIFFIAFLGCCGAWKENYCMITTFSVILSLIIIAEISTAITAYVYKDRLKGFVNNRIKNMMKDYKTNKEFKEDVDRMQQQLRCCGADNYTDWTGSMPNSSVPDSCCRNITTDCGVGAMKDTAKIYTAGCGSSLEELLKKNLLWVGVAVLVIAFIEIMGIVFACMLMRGIRDGYQVM